MKLLDSKTGHVYIVLDMAMKIFKFDGFANVRECYDFIKKHSMAFYIIEFKGQMVGCIYLHNKKGHVWIRGLYVDPEFRKRGIGTWLVALACQKGYINGHEYIHVKNDNPKTRQFFINTGLFWEHENREGILKGYGQYVVPHLDIKF